MNRPTAGYGGREQPVVRGGPKRVDVGVPDELERLWTPHRMAYISGDTAPRDGYDSPTGCPFCRAPELSDEDGLIVARGKRVYAVLNRFPYNPGHLLINPYRHVADYPDLDEAETLELAQMTQVAMTVIRKVSSPAGFNLGMNQGAVAGAGIAAHLHQHIVPRWAGDTNFMPVIGRTKTLPQLLGETRRLLAEAWPDQPRPAGRRRTTRASTQEAPAAKASPRSRTTATRRRTS
ncbi:MAG: HIT domain-containing protein [Micromonosporaceae bacterium]|nr:HIT domain-containing protein [Micromonosporaceae bacterium]